MNRILVIGAKGMLGQDLIPVLRSSFPTTEVHGWDIDEIDIREEKETIAKIEALCPNVVINLAAYIDVEGCESDHSKAFAINAEGMKHVALGALQSGAKIVFLSTDYVFDGQKREPYLESDLPNPINVYGHSKLKGEQYVQTLGKDGLIIRTQWLFGRYGNNFVSSILRQAREKKVLSIVDDQIGSPTYTVDLSKAIALLIQGNARGLFHAANRDFCSWHTFGQAILRYSGIDGVKVIPISSKDLNQRASRPSYSALDIQKIERVTGVILRPWPEALKEYLSSSG
jgi:dTDP-4-dehydrorhamnose reductase